MSPGDVSIRAREAVKEISARLLLAEQGMESPPMVLFCGVEGGYGTSAIASAVAERLRDSGRRTVLAQVGAQPGRASTPEEMGASEAVNENSPLHRHVVAEDDLLLSNPVQSPREWVADFEFMILDAPELGSLSTRLLIPRVTGVVLVLDGERGSVRAALAARERVAQLGGSLIGAVLNRFRSRIPPALARRLLHG